MLGYCPPGEADGRDEKISVDRPLKLQEAMRTLAISTVSFVASTRMAVLIFSSSIRVTNWQ